MGSAGDVTFEAERLVGRLRFDEGQVRSEHGTGGRRLCAPERADHGDVSIKSQKVTIYDADGWVLRAPVSIGKIRHERPAAVPSVVEKDKDHRSSLYDDARSAHAAHHLERHRAARRAVAGKSASHGCVRMPTLACGAATDKVRIGRARSSRRATRTVEFSHPALFILNSQAIAAAAGSRRRAPPEAARPPSWSTVEERCRRGEEAAAAPARSQA